MKPKTMILMGVAVVFGLASAYLTSQLLAKQQETVKVLKAKDKLTRWTALRSPLQDKLEEAEILKSEMPKNAVTSDKAADVLNRMLIKNLEKGDILSLDDLQSKDKGGLETEISEGHVAVAVPLTAQTGVGGFVLPGSHVNVIHATRDGQRNEAKRILENIVVKAVDLLPVRPDDRPGMVGATATLEVTPQEALKLASVTGTGTISLELRAYGDGKKVAETEVDPTQFVPPPPPPEVKVEKKDDKEKDKVPTEIVKAPEAPKAPEDDVHVVTVANGGSISQHVYYIDKATGKVKRSEVRDFAMPRLEAKAEAKVEKVPSPDEKKKDDASTSN